eukprot:scaffold123483_cov31-Attheya_sp.AAC.1
MRKSLCCRSRQTAIRGFSGRTEAGRAPTARVSLVKGCRSSPASKSHIGTLSIHDREWLETRWTRLEKSRRASRLLILEKRQRNSHIFLLKKREQKLDTYLVLESDYKINKSTTCPSCLGVGATICPGNSCEAISS